MGESRPKRKYTRKEAQKTLPAVKEFNSLAKTFLNLLSKKIQAKEKRLGNIKVMLDQMSPPPASYARISVRTVDINETIVKKSGGYSYNQKMSWEADLREKKRGFIL